MMKVLHVFDDLSPSRLYIVSATNRVVGLDIKAERTITIRVPQSDK